MNKVKLELEKLEILRPKERWQLYFVIITEHPIDSDKMLISTTPSHYIRLKPRQGNIIHFEPEGLGADGFTLFERELPENRSIKTRIFLRHSRNNTRDIGQLIGEVKNELPSDSEEIVTDLLGVSSPWLVVSKSAFNALEKILLKIKDRDFGLINMDESFGPEFESQTELDRENTFTSGDAKLVWSWSIS